MRRPASSGGVRPLVLPKVVSQTTASGVEVVCMRRPELPLVALRLVVPIGSAHDGPDRHGLADFTARLLRRGTLERTADQVNEAVEFIGASLSTYASEDFLCLTLTTPSEHLSSMLALLVELWRSPAFPESEVESARRRVLAQIRSELDDPGALAERALLSAVYGDHPYGHDLAGRVAHVERFNSDVLRDFHRTHAGTPGLRLFAVGDLQEDRLLVEAERLFVGLEQTALPVQVPALAARAAGAGEVVLVDKPDQTQTQIRIGAIGLPRRHPEYFPALAANVVLGGGFTSRLVTEIRVRRGLSYGASSHFDAMAVGGSFVISTFTRSETTRQAIDVALEVARAMRAKGPTRSELLKAQSYVAGIYPARFETNEALTSALNEVRFYGLPEDWVESFRSRIMAVTVKQAAEAAQRHLLTEPAALVLVGNADAILEQLEGLGPIRRIAPEAFA